MIHHGTNRSVLVLVLAFVCSVVWGGESKEIPIQPEFEISPTPLGPYKASSMGPEWLGFFSHQPAYAVAIPLVPPIDWLPSPGRRTMNNFVGNPQDKHLSYAEEYAGLSGPQKAFLQASKTLLNDPRVSLLMDRPDPNGPPRVLLYALTLEDAQKMAEGYFQYARNFWWRGYLRSLEKRVQDSTEKVARVQTRLAEVEKAIEASQKPLEDLKKTVPYRTENEAHEAIVELDRILNATQVEMAGIHARMDRIMGYRKERPPGLQLTPEAVAKLDMMLVEEDIALQGAVAREKKVTSLLEQASRFIDLRSALTRETTERKGPLVDVLEQEQKVLARERKELEATRLQEPKIPAKLIIYPVQWVDEPSQN